MDLKKLTWTAAALLGGAVVLEGVRRWCSNSRAGSAADAGATSVPEDGTAVLASLIEGSTSPEVVVVPNNFDGQLRDFPEDPFAAAVRVAVLDTGCTPHDVVLPRAVIAASRSFCGGEPLMDKDGHGTSMACLIAGGQDVRGMAVATGKRFEGGVVPRLGGRVELLIGKVCKGAFATHKDLAAALRWAVEEHADVVCVAFELEDSPAQCLLDALKDADCAGVMVVMASGNSGRSELDLPKHNTIVSVGAHDIRGSACHFTRSGATLLAPGTHVVALSHRAPSQGFHQKTRIIEGTSPATALVAGVVAYMKYRSLTARDIRTMITLLQHNQIEKAGSRSTSNVLFTYTAQEVPSRPVVPGGPPMPPPALDGSSPEAVRAWAKATVQSCGCHPLAIVHSLTEAEATMLSDVLKHSPDEMVSAMLEKKPDMDREANGKPWLEAFKIELQRRKLLDSL